MIAAFVLSLATASAAFALPLANVKPSTWVEIPGTRLDSAKPPGANVYGVVHAWSGGVYDTQRDRLVVWGGGHGDYDGNEVYVLPLGAEPQAWSRLSDPSNPAANNTARAADGRPVSRHTYNLLDYLPPPHDKMMTCGRGAQFSNGFGGPDVDFYDFRIDGFTGQPWSAGPPTPQGSYPGAFCAYNPVTQTMWFQAIGQWFLQSYNAVTGQWTVETEFVNEGDFTGRINTRDNYMISVGRPVAGSNNAGLVYYDLSQRPVVPVRITAMAGPDAMTRARFPGLAYVESENAFYAWSGGSALYKLVAPADRRNGTWTWTQVALDPGNTVTPTVIAGVKVAGYEIGTFGRFRYSPRYHGFIVINSHDENAYFFKLAGSGTVTPPPAGSPQVTLSANPASVASGGLTTLAWSSVNATACTASGGWSGSRTPSGSQSITGIAQTTSYTLTCTGQGGSGNATATVTVTPPSPPPAAPTVSLSANPASLTAGGGTTLSWSSANATSCTASGGWSGSKATSGTQASGALSANTAFTLSCSGAGGTTTASANVTVTPLVPPPGGGKTYSTTFDLTENPISEGGVWRKASNSLTDVRTANGLAFGTNGVTDTYDDSYALLSGFGPNQTAEAVVQRGTIPGGGITHEIELWLRFTDGSFGARGYEALFAEFGGVQIVRWDGNNTFVPLPFTGGTGGIGRPLATGDVLRASAIGNVISLYINGTLVGQSVDSTYPTGQPGIGFFIRPGGNNSGLAITRYSVSSDGGTPAPQPTVSLAANPASVASGGASTLSWSSTNATACTASGGWSGSRTPSGAESTGALTQARTYTLTCTGSGGSGSASATVSVQAPPPAPTVSLSANPTSLSAGGSSTLTWSSSNATSCTASGGWSGAKATSGTQASGALNANTTFTLSCTGAGGTRQASTTVTVSAAPPAPIVSLTANPASVTAGSGSTLSWSSANATSCTASGGWSGAKATTGTQATGALNANTVFTLSCSGGGGTASASASVTVTAPPTAGKSYRSNFDGAENPISEGGVWRRSGSGFTNVATANGLAFGTNAGTGSHDDSYALASGFGADHGVEAVVARDSGALAAVTHEVHLRLRSSEGSFGIRGYYVSFSVFGGIQIARSNGPNDGFTSLSTSGPSTLSRPFASGDVIKATITGNTIRAYVNGTLLATATDSTYTSGDPGIGFFIRPGARNSAFAITSVAVNADGAAAPAQPTVSLSASPASVVSGAAATLSWTSTNATGCTASGGWTGTRTPSGSESTGALTQARSYTLTCTGQGGSASASASVAVTAPPTAPVVSLTANPTSVAAGGSATLSWSSTNATSCSASGAWSGTKATSGSQASGALTQNSAFTLSCSGAGGSASATANVTISQAGTPPLAQLPPGRWQRLANTRMDAVAPPGHNVYGVMLAWSGGVYDTDRDQLVVWGGGHNDYAFNEVYAFGPMTGTPRWARLTDPTIPAVENQPRGPNGEPVSRHTYNLLTYLAAPFNKMMSCGIGSQYSNGYGVGGVDFYDFTVADPRSNSPWRAGPTAPSNAYAIAGFCAYNPVTQRVWYHDQGSNSARLQQFNPQTNVWTMHVQDDPASEATPAMDTRRNLLVIAGNFARTKVYDLNNPSAQPVVVPTVGPKAIENAKFPGFEYIPVLDQFIGWNGGAELFVLKPPASGDFRTQTWTWEQLPLDAGNTVIPTQATHAETYPIGTFGRFRYVPSLHGVMVVNATNEDVYFFKLPAAGGQPPGPQAPTVSLSAQPASVTSGGSATLSWSSTNASSCTASGGWSGAKAPSGAQATGVLTQSTGYTLTCTGAGGTASASATVAVTAAPPPAPVVSLSANPTTLAAGGSATLSWSATNASTCSASGGWTGTKPVSGSQATGVLNANATFTLSCAGPGGSRSASTTVTVTPPPTPRPTVTLSATPASVAAGGSATLSWTSSNASSCTASGAWSGSRALQGSQGTGALSQNAAYTLACTGAGGTASATANVAVTPVVPGAGFVSVSMVNQNAGVAQNGAYVTFGHPFKDGDLPAGASIVARLADGTAVPVQLDAKSTHPSGFVRHGVITAQLPALGAGATQALSLAAGPAPAPATPVSLQDLQASAYDTTVTFTIGGVPYTASARRALARAGVTQWLGGEQVSEWIAMMVPETAAGTPHDKLAVYFHVRAYRGLSTVRTDVVIENTWAFGTAGPVVYDAAIAVPGKTGWVKSSLQHSAKTRWHRVVWYGAQPEVYVKHDARYLQDSKATPKYENGIRPSESFLNSVRRSVEPLTNGDQEPDMPSTGYQDGIGVLSKFDAVYAISTDPRAFLYMLANADAGGAYCAHYRDRTTGLPPTIDQYPNSSLDEPRYSNPPFSAGCTAPYTHDQAHQPSIGFLPFVVTGDYFYLEETQAWSAHNLIAVNHEYRNFSQGWWYTGSLRGQGWAYRSLGQAAAFTPDNHPLKGYFNAKLANNLRHDKELYVSPGGPHKNALGEMYRYDGNHQAQSFFHAFMTGAIQYVLDLGYGEAAELRDYLTQMYLDTGLLGNGGPGGYCYQAAPLYTWKVGPQGTGTFYPDFATVFRNSVPGGENVACGTIEMVNFLKAAFGESQIPGSNPSPFSTIGDQTSPGYYWANLQQGVAAAVSSGRAGGAVAWERFRKSGVTPADWGNTPQFAIVPRMAVANPTPEPPPPPPPAPPTVSLSASPASVASGAAATLSWSSSHATSCTAGGGWAGAKATSGSQSTGALAQNTSFTLNCSGAGGNASATANVAVTAAPPPPAPTVTLAANPTTLTAGSSTTLSWSSANATSCVASGDWSGSKAVSGSQASGVLNGNASFTLTCSGAGGSRAATAAVTVTPPPPVPNPTATACDTASGRVLAVGPGKTYSVPSAAAAVAVAGDVIKIAAGDYVGDVATWRASNLSICGSGGRARLFAAGRSAGGKAIWVISGSNVTVDSIEFRDARVPDQNGAGIRSEAPNLTVRNAGFFDNEDGILAGDNGGTIVIERSEFGRNGFGDGQSHNIYVNAVDKLHVIASYFHEARIGHNLKSRARETLIENSFFMDGPTGTSSYLVDTPNGGVVTLRGNLFHKGPNADNSIAIAYGQEGLNKPVNTLEMIHNTVVMTRSGGTFIAAPGNTQSVKLTANIFAGTGSPGLISGFPAASVVQRSNRITAASNFSGADNIALPGFWPNATLQAQLPLDFVPDPAYTKDAPRPFVTRTLGSSGRLIGALQSAP